MQNSIRFPVAAPIIGKREEELVSAAVASGWVSSIGPFIDEFETQFARFVGVSHAVAVSSGTTALHLALHALGIGPGCEVIVPDLTFAATAHAVLMTGATPVFVDVDPRTWCMDPDCVELAITDKTRLVVAVHLYGHPADMSRLHACCDRRGIILMEDAAEAIGAEVGGIAAGALSRVGAFSFYGNKTITTGEGGMLTTNDTELANRVRFLKDHGMSPMHRYHHSELAFNYRLTNIQAALGVAQLERVSAFVQAKREIAATYRAELDSIPYLMLNALTPGMTNACWMSSVVLGTGSPLSADELAHELRMRGIDTRPFFIPMSQLPHLAKFRRVGRTGEGCPIALHLSKSGLNLPSGTALLHDEVVEIASTLRSLLTQATRLMTPEQRRGHNSNATAAAE